MRFRGNSTPTVLCVEQHPECLLRSALGAGERLGAGLDAKRAVFEPVTVGTVAVLAQLIEGAG